MTEAAFKRIVAASENDTRNGKLNIAALNGIELLVNDKKFAPLGESSAGLSLV